jgi:NADP-dependent alcohol dehydrogenase
MLNFDFYNPTRILFGKDRLGAIDTYVPTDATVLITYRGGSAKKSGLIDKVKAALGKRKVHEFGGIEPNPRYETLVKAVEVVRSKNIDFILAVGGGSVIDGTKFIYEHGKFPVMCELAFPKFSILDPTITFTLPKIQVANGVIDTFIHTTEQYITYPVDARLQDRIAEGILQTLIEIGETTVAEPKNYDARANLVWSATMALNGIIGAGVPQDWATHMIGHELTALFGIDHGQSLAIVLPAILEVRREQKRAKLLQYAERVWHIESGSEEEKIDLAIEKTRGFFESLGVKTRLSQYGVGADQIMVIVENLKDHGWTALSETQDQTLDISQKILERALCGSIQE